MVLLRHRQSVWNAENKFTGWTDIALSLKGEEEAKLAGKKLADIKFDVIHTSELKRAQRTAKIVMSHNTASENPPTHHDLRLNERHYGSFKDWTKTKLARSMVKNRFTFGEDLLIPLHPTGKVLKCAQTGPFLISMKKSNQIYNQEKMYSW